MNTKPRSLFLITLACLIAFSVPASANGVSENEQQYEITVLPDICISTTEATHSTTLSPQIASSLTAASSLYALVATDLPSSGYNCVTQHLALLQGAGYPYTYFMHDKTALQIYNVLSGYDVAILHGHGTTGTLVVSTDSTTSYLYSTSSSLGTNDAKLSNLSSSSLSAKVMIFTSCYSAATSSAYTSSLASIAYLKGAETTLGYKNAVAAGEYYSAIVIERLVDGRTFYDAIDYANELFLQIFPTLTGTTSPANSSNRTVYGSTSTTIWPHY